jgi:hypothetical protein
MKVTLEDALSLLSKYADERSLVLAVCVTPSLSVARVAGTIRVSITDGVPPHLIVGKADRASDQLKFRLLDCEFEWGDFREESDANKFEGFLIAASLKGDTLSLFELKS